ncbi:hypothetical protein CGCA056_v001341 [Colletotrichum aenigma]|uniref:uncharacterized protein n=1 Tax=Colletotrichum aenigma TaxID=1215731 RepID=UPI0018728665|nr:uncharacterized protein CGCA056_v001341 [Colletotrichum aenigma]KAF5526904.1 hypothetical protein CGCA056_v001341 [Colletotrichum aenigma]
MRQNMSSDQTKTETQANRPSPASPHRRDDKGKGKGRTNTPKAARTPRNRIRGRGVGDGDLRPPPACLKYVLVQNQNKGRGTAPAGSETYIQHRGGGGVLLPRPPQSAVPHGRRDKASWGLAFAYSPGAGRRGKKKCVRGGARVHGAEPAWSPVFRPRLVMPVRRPGGSLPLVVNCRRLGLPALSCPACIVSCLDVVSNCLSL